MCCNLARTRLTRESATTSTTTTTAEHQQLVGRRLSLPTPPAYTGRRRWRRQTLTSRNSLPPGKERFAATERPAVALPGYRRRKRGTRSRSSGTARWFYASRHSDRRWGSRRQRRWSAKGMLSPQRWNRRNQVVPTLLRLPRFVAAFFSFAARFYRRSLFLLQYFHFNNCSTIKHIFARQDDRKCSR